jgi:hypothetical protein
MSGYYAVVAGMVRVGEGGMKDWLEQGKKR